MTFEFIITCHATTGIDIQELLTEQLIEALETNGNEYDEDAVGQMIQLRHERRSDEGETAPQTIIGFTVELLGETESPREVIDSFASSLSGIDPILHTVKFEDPLLQDKLAEYAPKIFALEMKLRRVLSIIYLHAYPSGKPYNLLKDEKVQPHAKETPTPNEMKEVNENQFFHLTFSQYINLNQRLPIRPADLLELINDFEQYDAFRAEIVRARDLYSISNKDDANLLASLKRLMDSIEKIRNCVAHNRRPSPKLTTNYDTAIGELENQLDQYLERWEIQQ